MRSPFRQSVRYEEVGLPVTEGVHTHHPVQAGGDDLLAPENHQSEQGSGLPGLTYGRLWWCVWGRAIQAFVFCLKHKQIQSPEKEFPG